MCPLKQKKLKKKFIVNPLKCVFSAHLSCSSFPFAQIALSTSDLISSIDWLMDDIDKDVGGDG